MTHVGMKRSNNQDAYCVLSGSNAPPGIDALLAVADGMGGHQAGEIASNMAIQGLVGRLSAEDAGHRTWPGPGRDERFMAKVTREINAEVHRAGSQPETRGMGTTLTAAVLAGPRLLLAHVGDSRGYLYREGELHQITRDHSWVDEEISRGALTPDQARDHPRRNILTRALGTEAKVQVDRTVIEVKDGDLLLLCSDGLHSLVRDDEIGTILAREEPQIACEALVERANALGGGDNITVIVARLDKVGSGGKTPDSRRALDQMTTLEIPAARAGRRKGRKVLGMAAMPLRLTVGLFRKLLKISTGWAR